ncbi:MAG: preprotein translocase subunit SecE [Lachnospiraceae bacterium]|nr:preprotein translocase subunit SecE [Lachnospiraceae bacterium]
MEEKKKEATPKKSFFKSVKSEFSRIIWPAKDKLIKETGVVVIATLVLGVIIAALDFLIQIGLDAIL